MRFTQVHVLMIISLILFEICGYKVWIKHDDASGDIFSSSSSAIEKAFVVLMAMSHEYKKSLYCQTGE
jgi:hypothetical protein